MSINWKYKIELRDNGVFESLSMKNGYSFPDDLKEFIVQNNAAAPDKNSVIFNGVERVYDETLSFNEDEEEGVTAVFVMDTIKCNDYIPFARDPFGNYFLYSMPTGKISFYAHEEQKIEDSKMSLKEFLEGLH